MNDGEIIHAMFSPQAIEALKDPQQSKLKDSGQRTTGEERPLTGKWGKWPTPQVRQVHFFEHK